MHGRHHFGGFSEISRGLLDRAKFLPGAAEGWGHVQTLSITLNVTQSHRVKGPGGLWVTGPCPVAQRAAKDRTHFPFRDWGSTSLKHLSSLPKDDQCIWKTGLQQPVEGPFCSLKE